MSKRIAANTALSWLADETSEGQQPLASSKLSRPLFSARRSAGLGLMEERGARYAPLPGTNPGFLVQQNSMRDGILAALNLNIFVQHAERVRMANIAQMANVLQVGVS